MKSQVLHTVWCNIAGEAAGEIWHWSLLDKTFVEPWYGISLPTSPPDCPNILHHPNPLDQFTYPLIPLSSPSHPLHPHPPPPPPQPLGSLPLPEDPFIKAYPKHYYRGSRLWIEIKLTPFQNQIRKFLHVPPCPWGSCRQASSYLWHWRHASVCTSQTNSTQGPTRRTEQKKKEAVLVSCRPVRYITTGYNVILRYKV